MCSFSSSSTWKMEKVTGSHLFTIADYSLAKGMMGVGQPIRSGTFNVSGFSWTIECFLDGQDEHCAGWISLILRLETDAVAVRGLLKLSLLDPERGCPFTRTNIEVFSKQGSCCGIGKFIRRADFETSQFLRDDCFAVHCAVTVVKSPLLEVHGVDPVAVAPPPSDLHQHLASLLASGEGADVTFDVGGETFAAHRWLLAARSPVFRAELFGEMRETRMKQIQLEDIEPAVFKALLHFIYSDTLPSNLEEPTKESSSILIAQHLLAAADRYGLERLSLLCEDKLCRNIGVDTVANTLALAEQHRCGRLKAACLNFIASSGLLAAVIKTDGFEHLSISCPLVIKELLEKLAKATGQ